MQWKRKAFIQNAISILPPSISYPVYYYIQRKFGNLKSINPLSRFNGAIGLWKQLLQAGYDPKEKIFFEIGTGRVAMVPLAFWLMGAKKTITVDLNPYLRADLTEECINYILANQADIKKMYGDLIDLHRFESLIEYSRLNKFCIDGFNDFCSIEYCAPTDAAKLDLESNQIDVYTSYNVFEHIPVDAIRHILSEATRIIKASGVFVHRIDYSDHFSHDDPTITKLNFLQYSDKVWHKYAGNAYMYMNRLRHDDYIEILNDAKIKIISVTPTVDADCLALLNEDQIMLDERFRYKQKDILAITGAWFVTCVNQN